MASKRFIGTDGSYSTAGNWSPSGVPIAGDSVTLPAGGGSVTTGLNQSAVAIADFIVEEGYTGVIGVASSLSYLQINPTRFVFQGTGLAYIDLGASAISPLVLDTATASTGLRGLYLKGSALATLAVQKGKVGLAVLTGETSTVATVRVGHRGNVTGDASVWLGSGVTLTTWQQTGGDNVINCAATTLTGEDGQVRTEGTGAIGTINADGATIFPNSTGTITTLTRSGGAAGTSSVNFTRCNLARTVSTLTQQPGMTVIYDPAVLTITTRAAPSVPVSLAATAP